VRIRSDIELDEELEMVYQAPRKGRYNPRHRSARPQAARGCREAIADLVEVSDDGEESVEMGFRPTFTGSVHEREWILNYLGPFYDNHQITDVLRRVQGGKEANVYCCAAHPSTGLELVAAKVYRPRMFRNLRNDARYRTGRAILDGDGIDVHDDRLLRAVRRKTAFGRELAHTSWLSHEYQTLQLLYAAGVAVPRPLEQSENTILMAYLGEELAPAPTLQQVRLGPDEVEPLFHRLMENVELMMAHKRVHGDLSAYNVLYWEGEVWMIDLPQAIDPWVNPDAAQILQRDITRLCDYFGRYGIRSDPAALADDLWRRYGPPRIEPDPVDDTEGPDRVGPGREPVARRPEVEISG
jgi:RIO kinase 1